MKRAYQEAEKARDAGEVPVGAVVVKGNRIVGRGYNLKEKTKDPTSHAEMMAIRDAAAKLGGWRLIDCTMYVTLEPCSMCAGAIVQSRIKRVVIGTMDSRMGACGSNINLLQDKNSNHYVEIETEVLEQECSSILSDFFKKLRAMRRTRSER